MKTASTSPDLSFTVGENSCICGSDAKNPTFEGRDYRFRTAGDAELFVDIDDVCFHRTFADEEE